MNEQAASEVSPYRSSASFGKRQEFVAMAELLRRGFDVYLTLVDDQQIDCIIRKEVDGRPIYMDVQIKARSRNTVKKNAGFFPLLEIRKPRPNFFFIFYSEHADCHWVMPSQDVVDEATQNKTGRTKGKYAIRLASHLTRSDEVRSRPKFARYKDNFDILNQYRG